MGLRRIGQRANRKVVITLVCVAFLYFGVLPFFWPRPEVTTELPQEHPYDEDLSIKIRVFSWHKNVRIRQVRFYVDYKQTTAHGPERPFHPMRLFHSGEPPRRWPFFAVNRLTWPRSKELKLTLPLTRLAQEGGVRSGVVQGKLDVSIATPVIPSGLALWLGYMTIERTLHTPFTLRLVDH